MAEIGCEANPDCVYVSKVGEFITELDDEYRRAVSFRENTIDLGDNMSVARFNEDKAEEKRNKLSTEAETETALCEGDVCAVALAGLRCRFEQSKKGY